MRYAWLVVLAAFPASGQVIREGLSEMRRQGLELMLAVYRRPDVAEWCEKNPDGEITVQVNGQEAQFTVLCRTRREFLALIERPPQ